MKVEIWSDFVCPFCYIGKRRFEAALERFSAGEEVEVVYRSFELDPRMARDGNPDVYTMLSNKYGMTREQAIANTKQVELQAKTVGLDFDLGHSIQTNTMDAHRLAHYAAANGKAREMAERLFRAHFVEGAHIGRHDVLADLAAEAGLDRDEVLRVLENGDYTMEVKADEQEAASLGIRAVPFFLFDRKFAVAGAQSVEIFAEALNRMNEK